jgi:hypothetical protein
MKITLLWLCCTLLLGCTKGSEKKEPEPLKPKASVGDKFEGGYVWYVDSTGQHGLIVADNDLPKRLRWQTCAFDIAGTGLAFGTGKSNTAIVANAIRTSPCFSTELTAAVACDELDYAGYSDWFLPSLDEMRAFRQFLNTHGAMTASYTLAIDLYWTSTQVKYDEAAFVPGTNSAASFDNEDKTTYFAVRPMRAF